MPTEETVPLTETAGIRSASDIREGDRVVYPNQGVCRVLGIESKEIAGQKLEFVSMSREEDNATILVPIPKIQSIGLRKVAGSVDIEDVFDLLASSFEDPELDWKVRHRHHVDLLAAGEILGVAEVVKALQGIANLRALPQKERERYDAARRLLEDEIAVSLGVPLSTAEDFVDLALIPPPGTERAPRKPRRLAEIPVKAKAPRARRPLEEEEELEGLEEELEPLQLGDEEAEAEGEEEEVEEEVEAEEEAPKKKAAKPRAKKEPKAPAAVKATKAPAKKAAGAEAKAPPKAAAMKASPKGKTASRARKEKEEP